MTRTSQDDLLIAKKILIHYIDFLLTRAEQQTLIVEHEFLTLHSLPLSEESKSYIALHRKNHLDSISEYSELLSEIKRLILDFFTINQKALPLYSREVYRGTLQLHKVEVEKIFHLLLKEHLA